MMPLNCRGKLERSQTPLLLLTLRPQEHGGVEENFFISPPLSALLALQYHSFSHPCKQVFYYANINQEKHSERRKERKTGKPEKNVQHHSWSSSCFFFLLSRSKPMYSMHEVFWTDTFGKLHGCGRYGMFLESDMLFMATEIRKDIRT